jgi:hypothetical protein
MNEPKPMQVRRKEAKPSRIKLWLGLSFVVILCVIAAAALVVFTQKRLVTVARPAGKNVVIRVPAGGDLQQAINSAQSGDTIELQAGASYIGAFTLPYKNGNEFITIQSSGAGRLPEGKRVEAADAPNMAKILSSGKAAPAISTAARAHHYRFIGIEFAPSNADIIYNLVDLGSDAEKLADVPHHLEIDRSYLHPFARGGKVRRAVALNSADTIIKNSYLQGFAFPGEETQAIAGWNGTKNIQILNNKLEGGAENIMFGGADPKSADLIPSDILIQGNWIYKPIEWRGNAVLKTLFELKNAKRVQLIGNVLENAPDGETMRLTVRNQDGTAPFCTIEDITIKNNVFMRATNGTQVLGKDDINPSQVMKRVKIVNNLFLDTETYFVRVAGSEDVEIAHNTIFHKGNAVIVYGEAARFTMRDNIFPYNEYGFAGDGSGVGARALAKYFPGGNFRNNAVVNNNDLSGVAFTLPGGSFEVQGFNNVGFTNMSGRNFRLAPNSRLKGKASDSTDVGCNIDELFSAIPKDLQARIQ